MSSNADSSALGFVTGAVVAYVRTGTRENLATYKLVKINAVWHKQCGCRFDVILMESNGFMY